MREMLSLLWFEVKEEVGAVHWTVYQWAFFAFQYFVYGQLVSKLVVSVPNYYFYYGTGLLIIMTFNISTWAGRRFVEGAHEGRLRYILSLPLRRGEFFLEQVLMGLVVNVVRIGPPLVMILWITGAPALVLLTSMTVLLAMSAGIMGIMISLSFVAFKSFDIYSAIVAGMSAILIRFSTILYPLSYIPNAYANISRGNPLTYGADLLRSAVNIDVSGLLNPGLSAIVVLAVGVSTLTIGMALVPRVLEGVKSS
ncbi:MAG: ABC transporter permease [Thaumarchaeota archaeon]|nr:ABC transporter permease [Nitrososphaerota archaeon]